MYMHMAPCGIHRPDGENSARHVFDDIAVLMKKSSSLIRESACTSRRLFLEVTVVTLYQQQQ